MTHDVDGPELLAVGVDRGRRALNEHVAGRNVLAVLTNATADEWHHQWMRSGAASGQLALVECFDFTRGSGATAQPTVVSDDLAVATVERPVEKEQLRPVLDQFLDGWAAHGSDTVVYIESLDGLLRDSDLATVTGLLDRLRERTASGGTGLVAGLSSDCPPRAAATFTGVFDETVGELAFDADAATAIRRLRMTDPTTFGYFRSYWREGLEALDRTDRSYVQAGQLEAETELSARVLGATLSAFAQLGAISVRANTNGPNRYDCRDYDPEHAAVLGLTVESLPE